MQMVGVGAVSTIGFSPFPLLCQSRSPQEANDPQNLDSEGQFTQVQAQFGSRKDARACRCESKEKWPEPRGGRWSWASLQEELSSSGEGHSPYHHPPGGTEEALPPRFARHRVFYWRAGSLSSRPATQVSLPRGLSAGGTHQDTLSKTLLLSWALRSGKRGQGE